MQNLQQVVKELLIEYAAANKGKKPSRVIFFRDGLSDTSFDKVCLPGSLPFEGVCQERLMRCTNKQRCYS